MTKKIYSYAGLLIVLLYATTVYFDSRSRGFPDGHLTEYDIFFRNYLFPIKMGINMVFGFLFAKALFKNKSGRKTLIVYLILCVCIATIDHYFSIRLEHGQGG